ncbi:MAG: nuclear transport factor 2 family protein [Burkholderiaceae bacterium]
MNSEPINTPAQISTADDLCALERARLKALVDRNMPLAWQLHAPDFQLITPSGRVFSREHYLGMIGEGVLVYKRWEPGAMQVRMHERTALLRYPATLEMNSAPFQCWHIDSYELIDGLWQAVWSQATKSPE